MRTWTLPVALVGLSLVAAVPVRAEDSAPAPTVSAKTDSDESEAEATASLTPEELNWYLYSTLAAAAGAPIGVAIGGGLAIPIIVLNDAPGPGETDWANYACASILVGPAACAMASSGAVLVAQYMGDEPVRWMRTFIPALPLVGGLATLGTALGATAAIYALDVGPDFGRWGMAYFPAFGAVGAATGAAIAAGAAFLVVYLAAPLFPLEEPSAEPASVTGGDEPEPGQGSVHAPLPTVAAVMRY